MKLSALVLPLLFVIVAVFVLVWLKTKSLGAEAKGEPPFVSKRPFLENSETELLRRLRCALPNHHVFVQVQVSRVMALKKGLNASARTRWRNSIDRLSYDFVLCDEKLAVVAVIELDGTSHEGVEQAARDRKKNDATMAAGIKLVRYRNAELPDVAALAARFSPSQATQGPTIVAKIIGRREPPSISPIL